MEEGTFGEWLKKDGDYVRAGEPIYAIESEKALQEVESVDEGVLQILDSGPAEGDVVTVGTLLGYLLESGEAPVSAAAVATSSTAHSVPVAETAAQVSGREAQIAGSTRRSGMRISPRAARVAAELGVDPSRVEGSGRGGRIREADVRAAAQQSGVNGGETLAELPSLRRTIAKRMMESVQNTAPVTLTTQADAENLVSLREQYRAAGTQVQPTYLDMLVKLTALALQRHPGLNSRWTEAGIVQPAEVHIGIAVDTDDGLLVPVVRNADATRLIEIAAQTQDVIDRARRRACTADELTGGTFTITNLGAFGIDAFTPIINWPESAVLGIGAIRRVPVVLDDGSIAARHQVTLNLTFDHRVTDGAPAARFLQTLVGMVENPAPHLM
jgi:pyruvate dehydrogenase E2 component (dihydrolipoyllysine-residue acetyltransferase)